MEFLETSLSSGFDFCCFLSLAFCSELLYYRGIHIMLCLVAEKVRANDRDLTLVHFAKVAGRQRRKNSPLNLILFNFSLGDVVK